MRPQGSLAIILLALTLVSCGTTSKKLLERAPLSSDAAVEVFYEEPNLKYEKVCEIEAIGNNSMGPMYTKKEDFAEMFRTEARNCGADAVIFKFLIGQNGGRVVASATGIHILGRQAEVVEEQTIESFIIAISSRDLKKVASILKPMPKDSSQRAPSDDQLVNLGLYIAALDGLNCDAQIVNLLEVEYGAKITSLQMLSRPIRGRPEANIYLCRDVLARSFSALANSAQNIVTIYNRYLEMLEASSESRLLSKRVSAFRELMRVSAKSISEACKTSDEAPICSMKTAYSDLAKVSSKSKNAEVRTNGQVIKESLSSL